MLSKGTALVRVNNISHAPGKGTVMDDKVVCWQSYACINLPTHSPEYLPIHFAHPPYAVPDGVNDRVTFVCSSCSRKRIAGRFAHQLPTLPPCPMHDQTAAPTRSLAILCRLLGHRSRAYNSPTLKLGFTRIRRPD